LAGKSPVLQIVYIRGVLVERSTQVKVAVAARENARQIRKQAMQTVLKRKQDYLGARVPSELKQRVLDTAEELDIPVSLLIRQVLEAAFPHKGESKKKPLPLATEAAIIAWHPLELAQAISCQTCGILIEPSQPVFQVLLHNNSNKIICQTCQERIELQR